MKKVAIWAPLRYANYGDDLQAIIMAKYIKSLGYQVKLFQLEASLAKQYNMESVATVDALCMDINLCIIAGGGLLTPYSFPKRILQKTVREYEQDFKDLFIAAKKYDVKFCAISIGGDGKERIPCKYYSQHRIKFFRSSYFINGTVRLFGDVQQMKKFEKDFIYYPDMLFRISDYCEYDKLEMVSKYRIGINFKKGRHLDYKLLDSIYEYAENHNDIEFHFTTTHMQKIGLNYQYIPEYEYKNIKIDKYESPKQLLGVLASMDVFITSMLHLGLTGLALGTPFISYRGPGKAKSFLKSIGGHWAIVDDHISFKELKEQFFCKNRIDLYNQYDTTIIAKMVDESLKHYQFCKLILEKHS
ncbi:hypothetical protein EZS27_018258 [termite gut metagenome]|uniref:Polysaccharide pyruvyl transferase domain-containing protein n=1 Tax=termite gut metagenome TaxID=433724 RepID=A0A5J4RI67_9ZZZZ